MSVKADLVSGILPVHPDGRMLLLLRPSGTWDPPAGRLAPGESFERGAVREVYEETGLLVAPQRLLATWVGKGPGGGLLASATYVSRVSAERDSVRLSDEHLGYRWVTTEEWLDLPSWWSRENILDVAGAVDTLPDGAPPEPPPPAPPRPGVVNANLGAGTVVVDLGRGSSEKPRALLMRRRKPPVGLWENPGGMLEPGEDFVLCARREVYEETGLDAEPEVVWWARVEPWRAPDDPELYAGVGFIARHPGGEVRLESSAHDAHVWATEEEWRGLNTWYTGEESDVLWNTVREMKLRNSRSDP
ncbi:MAG: NUDIX hydrolase [Actinobacteria bacterium]|nr:NUDIX hydrolase [Actinomycetota bacterium]